MPTIQLIGCPVDHKRASSSQSGKAFFYAEVPTPANSISTYNLGPSLQILQGRGVLSRAEKRAFFKCEKEIDKARDKAASNGRNADKAENHVRDKHESKAEEKKLHEI